MSMSVPNAGAVTPHSFVQVTLLTENGVKVCAHSETLLAPEHVPWAVVESNSDASNSAQVAVTTRPNMVTELWRG